MAESFKEPTKTKYIYINEKNNTVHLMLPVMRGMKMGLDNTCMSVYSLRAFFIDGLALKELKNYKEALEQDIASIKEDSELKKQKQSRLEQIKRYISAVHTVLKSSDLNCLSEDFPSYPKPLQSIMGRKSSNLYSMVLRPAQKDEYLRSVKPLFHLKRKENSVFYQTLQNEYKKIKLDPNRGILDQLITAVVISPEGRMIDFQGIQNVLKKQTDIQLGIKVDFNKTNAGMDVTKDFIDKAMGYDSENPATAREYVEALLGYCAPNLFDTLSESPFSNVKTAEELSLLTQFFLASVNIYCVSHDLVSSKPFAHDKNFGAVLDGSKRLSKEISDLVVSGLQNSSSIEDDLLHFINENSKAFHLGHKLTPEEMLEIKRKFTEQYAEIRTSPKFDEFMVLDDKPGDFIAYQGEICTDFSEFIKEGYPSIYSGYFESVCSDFKRFNGVISHKNEFIKTEIKEPQKKSLSDKSSLMNRFKLFKSSVKPPTFDFLHCVARGQQEKAEQFLEEQNSTLLLLQRCRFTDYSGRTFFCTAYEYAYWSNDKHMRDMLEKYMDKETKAEMLKCCEAIERKGLIYEQAGKTVKNSKHFDLTPLINALEYYVEGYEHWKATENWSEMEAAWLRVGIAQCDVPAHVAQEYCRLDRSFDPLPDFNEREFPRNLTFTNLNTNSDETWFPLVNSVSSRLGIDFALSRPELSWAEGAKQTESTWNVKSDLAAMIQLNKVRTADCKYSIEKLKSKDLDHGHDLSFSMPFRV